MKHMDRRLDFITYEEAKELVEDMRWSDCYSDYGAISDLVVVEAAAGKSWFDDKHIFVNKVVGKSGLHRYGERTSSYYAAFIVESLRQPDKDAFKKCLFYLYLCELTYEKGTNTTRLYNFRDALRTHIGELYGIECYARISGMYSGLPNMPRAYVKHCQLLVNSEMGMEHIIDDLYDMSVQYWKRFFTVFAILSYEDDYYKGEKRNVAWRGYIVWKGEPAVFDACPYGEAHYKSIREIIAENKYDAKSLEKGTVVYLDGDMFNFTPKNVVLFATETDYKRWKVGGASYTVDENNIYRVTVELTRVEFKNLVRHLPIEHVGKMFGKTYNQMVRIMQEYNIPKKTQINAMTDAEYEAV